MYLLYWREVIRIHGQHLNIIRDTSHGGWCPELLCGMLT